MITSQIALHQSWIGFLRRYDSRWSHVFHLSFATPHVEAAAWRYFNRRWLPRLTVMAGEPVLWFAAQETGAGGHLHFHGLLSVPSGIASITIRNAWERGLARVNRYDRARGIASYATKWVAKEFAEHQISDPPIPRHGTRRGRPKR